MPGKALAPRGADGKLLQIYDAEVMGRICVRIAAGETLNAICKGKDQPTTWTFRNWILHSEQLREMYAQARELKAHSLFDEALDAGERLPAFGQREFEAGYARRLAERFVDVRRRRQVRVADAERDDVHALRPLLGDLARDSGEEVGR